MAVSAGWRQYLVSHEIGIFYASNIRYKVCLPFIGNIWVSNILWWYVVYSALLMRSGDCSEE